MSSIALSSRLRRFVVTLVWAAPTVASAQTIGGRAVDVSTHRPLRLIDVALFSDTVALARAQTDTSGVFYLDAPREGVYQLFFLVGPQSVFKTDTFRVAGAEFIQREFRIDVPRVKVYLEFEVEKQVEPMAGNRAPRYPDDLRAQNVTGDVLAQFVVDTLGRIEIGTFKVLRSSDPGFTRAVRDALPGMRFHPAQVLGRRVRQLVQMPFQFDLTRY